MTWRQWYFSSENNYSFSFYSVLGSSFLFLLQFQFWNNFSFYYSFSFEIISVSISVTGKFSFQFIHVLYDVDYIPVGLHIAYLAWINNVHVGLRLTTVGYILTVVNKLIFYYNNNTQCLEIFLNSAIVAS